MLFGSIPLLDDLITLHAIWCETQIGLDTNDFSKICIMTHHGLLVDGVQREDRDMEVDDCGLAQELGSPVLVVGLGGNGQDVRERQTRLVVGDQLGALRVVSASVEQPCKI